ncbi:MAG: hypothetical protein LBM13_02600 [Candidatus Ancillula sp.]|jgi:hypothetical protein|nr:hypothetical protein [Candidatus Ancillula sp.]
MAFILLHEDKPLIRFEMETVNNPEKMGRRDLSVKIIETYSDWDKFHPINLEKDNKELSNWLKKRILPNNRGYVENFLNKLGLNLQYKDKIIEISNGLSLNDVFWVWNEKNGKPFEFKDVNLYDNKFSEILGAMAFDGGGSNYSDPLKLGSSPEYTTGGMLAKAWRSINGKISLWKSGTEGFANAGKEPYSEYYSAQVAKKLGIKSVDYSLEMWKEKLCSVCSLFTSKDLSFVNVGSMVKKGGMPAVIEYYKRFDAQDSNKHFVNDLTWMMIFDGVVVNHDRHFGNFGFLVNNDSNVIVDTAPLFDHGLSLLALALDDELEDYDIFISNHPPIAYDGYIDFLKPYITDYQRDQLSELKNFEFIRHPKYNLSEKRLEILEKMIRERAKQFIDLRSE